LGKTVVLNPAPARALPASLLGLVDYLIPNEVEAAALAGIAVETPQDAMRAGQQLLSAGVKTVLVTLGAQGVVTVDAQGQTHAPAQRVDVVDTTAAGDTFIGGFCAALLPGDSVARAVAFGQAAAAICVTRPGAQPSIPFAREVRLPG
jgi:ribokinase